MYDNETCNFEENVLRIIRFILGRMYSTFILKRHKERIHNFKLFANKIPTNDVSKLVKPNSCFSWPWYNDGGNSGKY